MPSQAAVMDQEQRQADDPEKQLFEAIVAKNYDQVVQIIRENPDLNLNCMDKDELTPLQHVCHTGEVEIARTLINNGADVNFTQRKDGYTPLMFAAISSKADVVRLLLERGVDTTVENCVHRTAAQMAAFVGQSKIVSIINSWIPYDTSVEPYTRCRELEDKPRIPFKNLGRLLHQFIIYPSLHPIKLMLFIRDNLNLVKYGSQFVYVLENLSSKSLRPPNNEESLSLKYHYLSYLINTAMKSYKAKQDVLHDPTSDENKFDLEVCAKVLDNLIRKLIRRTNPQDMMPCTPQLDHFIMDCLMKFPYTQLAIFKTMTYALTKREPGDLSAYAILTQTLNGPRMFGHATEACSICCELDKTKKCSKCKSVYYCGPQCQQIDWFQHKKVCKSPEEEPLIKQTDDNED